MNFKKTLNIINTDFSMKANLNWREPQLQQWWLEQKIYEQLLKQNQKNPQWILHDGPPYANGDIHVGHATNKILKDIIVRWKSMEGYYSPYIPGWDTHGLPIEAALEKNNKHQSGLTPIQKRQNCYQFALEQIQKQKKQFSRLGLVTNFEKIYQTFDHKFQIDQLEIFSIMLKKGLIYQALKPVYWSWSSQTALAEAEIIYLNKNSHSIFVAFNLIKHNLEIKEKVQLIIWTTTPFTLTANLAVAVHPEFNYSLISVENQYYLVGENTLNRLAEQLKWNEFKVIKSYKGKELENWYYINPLTNEEHFIVLADYVSDVEGTGLVHNAPGFGLDDYLTCKKYNIEPYCPIDNKGCFTNDVKLLELVGMFYEDSNLMIIEKLKEKHALLNHSIINHSYPHDWRTNKPLIFRATSQWFVNIEKIKPQIVKACEKIEAYPKWVLKQLKETVLNRAEWCISRQRVWGVPIPILFDENNQPLLDPIQIDYTIEILNEKGIDSWYELNPEDFLLPKYQKKVRVTKSKDIMDVWFDSGTSYTILKRLGLHGQCQLYLEGNDQFRGWFNSSIITSVIVNNQSPYQNLISHGFLLDENGYKMSKSKGNVIDPIKVCNELGADVLRLWVASVDYTEDMNLGPSILEQTSLNYRKIRNTFFRFVIANLQDFVYEKDVQKTFHLADQYILFEFKEMMQNAILEFKQFRFYRAIKLIINFLNIYSGWYLEIIKDNLYCDAIKSKRRLQIQTILHTILEQLLIFLAPILVHTTEEAYQYFSKPNKKTSIHLEKWVDLSKVNDFNIDKKQWETFFKIKDLVYEKIEKARNNKEINRTVDAAIILNNDLKKVFNNEDWKYLLQVAEVIFENTTSQEQILSVKNSELPICERCRLHYVIEDLDANNLCKRCAKIMKNF